MRGGPILIYVIGIAMFSVMDATMKHLVSAHPVMMAAFWRYAAATLFILPFWWREGRPPIRREMLPVHLVRGLLIAASAVLFFWSLSLLRLAETVTIAFLAPLLVPPLASLILKERMQAASIIAGFIGFAGVLVAIGFDWEGITSSRLIGAGAALSAAFTYALVIVFTRMRAARDGPSMLSLLGALIPLALIGPAMLLTLSPEQWLPTTATLPFVLLAGMTGAFALQFIARAYARAEAQLLAPFEYTALFWAALFGWLFFAEPVAPRTWLGAAIIIAACLWQMRHETRPA